VIDSSVNDRDQRRGASRPAASLIGREAELERLRTFVAHARADGGTLLVTGEPGIGKTVLLEAAARDASDAGTRVLRAAGIEFEAGMSFSGLNQLLFPLLDTLPVLAAAHRDALNVALGFGEGTPPSALVVSNAVLMLLRTAAADRALLLIVDDLPWLDRASAGALSFAARRLEDSHIGLLGASRTGEQDFFDHGGLPELDVQRLDDAASAELLVDTFPDLTASVRDRILAEAQGNPLGLLELPAALGPGLRTAAGALPGTLPLNRRLQALFGARIAMLPGRTRDLLLRMALDGTGDVRLVGDEPSVNAGFRDLAPAEEARLAYLDGAARRLAFRHPLVRSTVVDLAGAEEQRAAHLVLAELWADQPDLRAWHLAEATVEPDESVAAELEAAAGRRLARGDVVGCINALTRASDLSPRAPDRRRRLAAAAYVGADVAGDLAHASQVLAELRAGDAELAGSLQSAVAAAAFLLQAGDVSAAHRLLVRAIETRLHADPAADPFLEEALHSLMMLCYYGGQADLWDPFEAITASLDAPLAVIRNSRTFADPVRTGIAALPALEATIDTLDRETDPAQIVRTGIASVYVDRLPRCRDALWRVVRDAREGGAVASGILALNEIGFDSYWAGNWDEADALVGEAIAIADSHGYRLQTWPPKLIQALIASARGDDGPTEELHEVLEWARPRGFGTVAWYSWHTRGFAALGRGDFEEAYQQATRISAPGVLASHVPHALLVLMDVVEAAVRTGRHDQASAHVAAMHDANLAALSTRLALVVGGCSAMAASDEAAPALFERTLALPDVERWQLDLARVRLAYGERLRRGRALTAARVQLNAALATFQRLRAVPWMERTSAELRASGQAKPHAGDNVLDRLTPQEFEVATLAASGLTNKQIAERLFLSHRTVGGHLHRAFPKLGVSTRAALRDALESLPPDRRPLD
jgi:DNA-binding CsgD family transcriptional regulator